MRTPLLALIPAALIASAAHAQEPQEPTVLDMLPAEEQTAEAPPEPPEVETTAATGSWERSAAAGRDTATFISEEGDTLFTVSCMDADTDTGDGIIEIKAVSAEDNVGAIDMFTSAGNARLPAEPDTSPELATGMIEPVSQPTFVLASGAGEMRIVSGSRGIVFETDPMLRDVIRNCQPGHRASLRRGPADMAEETSGEAEEAERGS